ncbi:hypothetical protein CTAYLR_010666 [Chrysophaeum taylorii]|uniref:COMM domain-containing protein n=1 Tax=Chrysophaeum taylorii TaxID=2483200 RepID=A0AAD7U682_9STRA|nr:hypothetical protein CTAYLR_010666 [Chrysophaeum taylorii]
MATKPSLTEALSVANAMPAEAFKSISRRVVRRLGDPRAVKLLTAAEEEQACSTLGLTGAQVAALLELCAYIFEQAAYQMQRPDQFEEHAKTSIGLAPDKASAARQVWEAEATAYVARLRERHVLGPQVLRDTTWATHLCLAHKTDTKSINDSSTAVFDLHLADDKASDDHLVFEASHQELYGFFQKLQDVQRAIDNLSS